MNLQEITLWARAHRRVEDAAKEHQEELYRLIREGRKDGASWGQLAEASGLSRERVRQVCGAGVIATKGGAR